MNDFFKMDFFFVVTTIVVLLAGTFLVVALYYLVRILKSVDHLVKNVSEESDHVREDIGELRERVREEGMKVKHLVDFFSGMKARRQTRRKTKGGE